MAEAVETETSHTGAITNRAELSKGQAVAMQLSSATAQQRTTGAAALTWHTTAETSEIQKVNW